MVRDIRGGSARPAPGASEVAGRRAHGPRASGRDGHRAKSDLVLVGLGALGAALMEILARQGLPEPCRDGTVLLVDHDRLQRHNVVGRSALYVEDDVGLLKVEAARRRAREISPGLNVVALAEPVGCVGVGPFLQAAITLIACDTYIGKLGAQRAAWQSASPMLIGELAGGHGPDALDSRYRYFVPGAGRACVECTWSREYDYVEEAAPCHSADLEGRHGPFTGLSVAMRTASLMVEEAERLLAPGARGPSALEVRVLPRSRRFLTLHPPAVRSPACLFDHEILDARLPVLAPNGADLTVGEAFAQADSLRHGLRRFVLREPVATRFVCARGHEWSVLQRLSRPSPRCPACGSDGLPLDPSRNLAPDLTDSLLDTPIAGQVVAPGDCVRVVCDDGEQIVALPRPASWRRASDRPTNGGDL